MSIVEQDDRSAGTNAPRMTARERRRLETQERIRTVAFELFRSRGFEATTVDEIAAAAEVSRRTFFNHFPNKDDVVSQQFESLQHVIKDAASRHAATASCPYEIAKLAACEAFAGAMPDDLRDALQLFLANRTLAIRGFGRQLAWEQAVIDAINEVAPDRFDPDEVAAGVACAFAVIRVASLRWATEGTGDFCASVEALAGRFAPASCLTPVGSDNPLPTIV